MPANLFKRALAAGQVQVGVWSSLSSPMAAEIVAGSGREKLPGFSRRSKRTRAAGWTSDAICWR
jgi:hypothetical protein